VLLRIDWEKRHRIMKLHFAAEIILELVTQLFGNPEKIGANITSEKARIDFAWDDNIAALFPVLETRARELIMADKPIESLYSNEAEQRRYWQVEGFGRVACGGTHPRRTGEVGTLRLKRERLGKSKERIEIYLA
jgi:Ser-tRNA(Ala) deacylase AlaX